MVVLILAAGYATRLYPLTLDRPKPLLPIADRPMVEHIMEALGHARQIEQYLLVSNNKFAAQFTAWAQRFEQEHQGAHVRVINDGSTCDADKLGAIGDIRLVIERERIDTDLVIVAGDNLFDHSLAGFIDFCLDKREPAIGVYDVGCLEEVKKYSSITVAPDGRVVAFEEKPQQPTSTLTGIALYYLPRKDVHVVQDYVNAGNNPDQPGRLIQWLYPRQPVYAWNVPGTWYDIGTKETLAEADGVFRSKLNPPHSS